MVAHCDHVYELLKNPVVDKADHRRIKLKTEFRIRLFRLWKNNDMEGIDRELTANGLGKEITGDLFRDNLINGFKSRGFPVCYNNNIAESSNPNPLLESGKFYWVNKRRGMKIDPAFEEELFQFYPEISIEEGLCRAGLDPVDVGYGRILQLKKEFDKRLDDICQDSRDKTGGDGQVSQSGDVLPTGNIFRLSEPEKHPYVSSVTASGRVILKEVFYNEAYLLYNSGMEKIMQVFEIPEEWVKGNERGAVASKLARWIPTSDVIEEETDQVIRIWQNREKAMTQLVAEQFEKIRGSLEQADTEARRMAAKWIRGLPRDPWRFYSTRRILDRTGFSKSTYYELLSNESYGRSSQRRQARDDEDILLIKQVAEYKGYAKGYRQISMMMESVTGQVMSEHRVLYLMRKYGMRTNIRLPSKNRKAMKELMKRNGKGNLLMRRFKLHRPNEVRLTDVTYLDYGDGLRAYGSASVDPVTNRLICFVISENNDLELALDTLEAMDEYPAVNGGIIHSDQGILYFTDDFQAAVKERDLIQSMSRRGNCWDNAPQESFFGHFKDESGYNACRSLKDLKTKVADYSIYYNNERRIHSRGKMTPAEYEAYLTAMDDEAFAAYMADEEEKYLKKKEKAAAKAAECARERREAAAAKLEEIANETGR